MNEVFEKRDPAFDRIIGDSPRLDHLATGFGFTEGPVWRGDHLLFSDIPNSRIVRYELAEEGPRVTTFRYPSGNSNGMTLDRERRLVTCEHTHRRVSRTGNDGRLTVLASRYDGRRFNSPNDVVVKSDGSIYFTDPPYGITPGESSSVRAEQEQPCNGLYRIRTDGTLERLVDDFDRPNGLAFSPDESLLYVADSPRRHLRAFAVDAGGGLTDSRIFAAMDHPQPGAPDGMKVDVEGHLYVAGATGVWVFEPTGTCLGVIVTPERPTNCAWGDDDRRSLYITARPSLYRIRVSVPGARGAAVAY